MHKTNMMFRFPLRRIIFAELCFGAAWAFVPGILSEVLLPIGQGVTVIVAGMITGVIICSVLCIPLFNTDWKTAVLLGLLSLPLGAFCFGLLVSFIQLLVYYLTGAAYRFTEPRFDPLATAVSYARGTLIPYLAAYLVPLSVLSSYYFQRVLKSANN